MFVEISESLSQLSSFTVLGFFFGVFYEVIRIIRLFKKQSDLAVSVTDFVFLSLAGLITFAYSMELGNGQFRWFYIAGAGFGGAIYFLTLGRLVSLASNFIVRCIKRAAALAVKCMKIIFLFAKNYIFAPLHKIICKFIQFLKTKIGYIYVFMKKKALNSSNHLKSKARIVYNKRTERAALKIKARTAEIINTSAGVHRNVIKGKIRRRTAATVRKT
ncbi:MAG: spore cortex biosynthesis protein YabQ [Oscillospiraceae bacterium]|nr:spore cortex biosynthesis protein YabQ [Oscillospiraceae bacterium]